MSALLLVGAVAIGVLLAVQASVNPRLAKAVGTPYGGATVQLWVAVGLLILAAVVTGAFGAFGLLGAAPGWYLLGGLASPLYITSGILLFPRIGALAAGGLFVAGQVLGSVTLDLLGLLGVDRKPLTVGLVVGVAAVLAGIAVVVRAQATAPASPARAAPRPAQPPAPTGSSAGRTGTGWIVLGLLAGAVLPFQGAINARLRTVLIDPVAVALTSFVVAAVTITIVLLVLRLTKSTPAPKLAGVRTMPWWGWLGGACAVLYVSGTFLLIPEIGAATTIVLTVTGQQLAAAVIDARGAFGLSLRPITLLRAQGIGLLVAGSVLVELL